MIRYDKYNPSTLFILAEHNSKLFSLKPDCVRSSVDGLIRNERLQQIKQEILCLDKYEYVDQIITPANSSKRPSAVSVVKSLNAKVICHFSDGPFYQAELEIPFQVGNRRIGVIAQDRKYNNGVWMPSHHDLATKAIRQFSELSIPILFLIDTPGADAGEEANCNNQAHSISKMIAESANVSVPTLGIVLGVGYSGGAIPLAATNLLLSVRDGVFNTIQPQGLQSIVHKFNLSWQECAKLAGVSPVELLSQRCIDGIIDYSPMDTDDRRNNLHKAIVSAIDAIEADAISLVSKHPEYTQYYDSCVTGFVNAQSRPETKGFNSSRFASALPTPLGLCLRHLRYLRLRGRIHSISNKEVSETSLRVVPRGDLSQHLQDERARLFNAWMGNPDKLIYDEYLYTQWEDLLDKRSKLSYKPNKIARLIWGEPKNNYDNTVQKLIFDIGFSLYNRWKTSAASNFKSLLNFLYKENSKTDKDLPKTEELTLLDIVSHQDFKFIFIDNIKNLLTFDLLYDTVIERLEIIAKEAMDSHRLSRETVGSLLNNCLSIVSKATKGDDHFNVNINVNDTQSGFREWLIYFLRKSDRGECLLKVEEWKSIGFPQLNNTLFVILTCYFEKLLPEYFSTSNESEFQGVIKPYRIGRRKDFWNRLTIGYRDLLFQRLLRNEKREIPITPESILKKFFTHFEESLSNRTSADPVSFPGFQKSITSTLANGQRACGLVTGIAEMDFSDAGIRRLAVAVSNVQFQAGSFDMASAEKLCNLLVTAAQQLLPVVCFISSGGMQTKEGAAALFSMAVVNDRITRFVSDTGLPVLMFGFGDCTGGAQASFVTHPLVRTYYFSGTNMPFAGQRVVPAYLPATSTLSNYLSLVDGSMTDLVLHPFSAHLDKQLKEIDPEIPVPVLSVEKVIISTVLETSSDFFANDKSEVKALPVTHNMLQKPVDRVLIHARGCTAVKLIRIAQQNNIAVVLTVSDPDLHSVAAHMLSTNDKLVCLGGSTSDESYLNPYSVLRVAEMEKVQHLHPGIGFLSESSLFAKLCVQSGINFIGPSADSMLTMGNKSNAISAALACGVPIVPGSHGVLSSADQARIIAGNIGYPVLLKAVFGGGGKGIQVVHSDADMLKFFNITSSEASAAFGSGDLYLEKFVQSMRHIEVQILRDSYGNTKILGLRDCSVQRNNQKIIEESRSTILPDHQKNAAFNYASLLADKVDYCGAGTVEFIYDISNDAVYFMEMNTRLQVEHPVTEASTGIDIVKAQFDIAGGKSIDALQYHEQAYAMELRITAEKLAVESNDVHMKPDPGRITRVELPKVNGIDIISAVEESIDIPPFYDSLIAQVIAKGESREAVIESLLEFLGKACIEGVSTNICLLKSILGDEIFLSGNYDVNFIQGFFQRVDIRGLIEETDRFANTKLAQLVDINTIRVKGSNQLKVVSTFNGIIYQSSSPGEDPFIQVGDIIDVSKPVLMSEAMKVFRQIFLKDFNVDGNEFYSEDNKYRVEEVFFNDGQQITAGDLLFIVSVVVDTEIEAA